VNHIEPSAEQRQQAAELRGMYNALVTVGFDDRQAFDIVLAIVASNIDAVYTIDDKNEGDGI
jgi:hypothetical protein